MFKKMLRCLFSKKSPIAAVKRPGRRPQPLLALERLETRLAPACPVTPTSAGGKPPEGAAPILVNGSNAGTLTLSMSLSALDHQIRKDRAMAMVASLAIGLGDDTDTVAAMAGALVGAFAGMSAIPSELLAKLEDGPAKGRSHIAELAIKLLSPRMVK